MRIQIPSIELNKYQLFTALGLFWVGLGWLGLLLALFGIFYKLILLVYCVIGMTILLYLFISNRAKLVFNYRFYLILLLSLLAVFIFSYYSTPTIFSGRDQGSLSEAAIRLTQNHQLEFSTPASQEFFQIYGPGKALNFPGFSYTSNGQLITQFPLGYIAWLAVFFSIFGLSGFVFANAVTFFLFLLSFYLMARHYLRASSAVVVFLLALTSFVFAWFFKFTLSENLALGLLWFGIYEFVLFVKNKTNEAHHGSSASSGRFHLLVSLLSIGLLSFARVEALAFLAILGLILIVKYRNRRHLFLVVLGKKLVLVLLGIILIYLFNIAVNYQAYYTILKGLVEPFLSYDTNLSPAAGFFPAIYYTTRIFMAYGLLVFLIFGVTGIIYFLRQRKLELLVPFLIVLPNFIYLINPSISADHPWMLRRFIFGIIPICLFYTVYFFDTFLKKRAYFFAISALLLVSNLLVLVPYLTVSPDKNLLPQIEDISSQFETTDLLLVDREATGNGWSMMSGPLSFLYNKQAVYFFNPDDLARLDLSTFSKVYLIIPDKNIGRYKNLSNLLMLKGYQLNTAFFDTPEISKATAYASMITLPKVQPAIVQGHIYLYNK